MRVAVSGGLLMAFLLLGGILTSRTVQGRESAPHAAPAWTPPSASPELPRREALPPTPPYGLIAPVSTAPSGWTPAIR